MAWYRRFWNIPRPGRLQSDVQKELAFHLAERAEELELSGMSEADAIRLARLQFGNLTTQVERTRDMDISSYPEATLRNLRLAVRGLAKTPGFTVSVILTLALGIGANSAVFSAIYTVLLRPLPFPGGDELVRLAQSHPKVPQPFVAPVRLEEWNRLNNTLEGITGSESQGRHARMRYHEPRQHSRIWRPWRQGIKFEALEILFGPVCLVDDALQRFARERSAAPVKYDGDPPPVRVVIDLVGPVPAVKRKPVTDEGGYDLAGGEIAKLSVVDAHRIRQ